MYIQSRLLPLLLASALVAPAKASAAAPLSVSAPAIPAPVIQRVPLRAGLCVSPALSRATMVLEKREADLDTSGSAGGGRERLELGNAVVTTLRATLRASFGDVEILADCTPKTAPTGDLQVNVAAQLRDAHVVLPRRALLANATARERQGQVELLFTLRSAIPKPPLTWSVTGTAFTKDTGSPSQDVATSLSAALRNASARFLADLSANVEVRSWLASVGGQRDPAGNAGTAAGPQTAGGVAVAPDTSRAEAAPAVDGRIAILSNGLDRQLGDQTAHCLSTALENMDKSVRVMGEDQFREAFFPWFEYDVAPADDVDAMAKILINELIQERARQSDVQYVVLPTAAHTSSNLRGPFMCGAAGEGAGCLGAAVLHRDSEVVATVWDVRRGLQSSSLTGHGQARDAVIGFVVPLWIPGGRGTKALACRDMAGSLLDVIHGDTQARLMPIPAASAPEESTEPATTDEPPSPGADAERDAWADEREKVHIYPGVSWFADTDDIARLSMLRGTSGALLVADQAVIFRATWNANSQTSRAEIRIPYDEVASVEYRSHRVWGSLFMQSHGIVVTRKDGRVDTFAVMGLVFPKAADTEALAKELQSKLRENSGPVSEVTLAKSRPD